MTGSGIAAYIFPSKAIAKSGIKITTSLNDCQPDEIKIPEFEFYFDQNHDAVKATVEANAMQPLYAFQRTTHCYRDSMTSLHY